MYGSKKKLLKLKLFREFPYILLIFILSFTLLPGLVLANEVDGPPTFAIDTSNIPDAVPLPLPYSSTGNPPYYEVNGKRYYVLKTNKDYEVEGIASWYGAKFQGKATSSGELYDMFAMTAASPVLPIPSFVTVTNLTNGKTVVVKVNDRGPFHENRVMDLSYAAAKKLGIYESGTGLVKIVAINTGQDFQQIEKQLNWYLQVATFKQRSNADNLASQLQNQINKPVNIHLAGNAELPLYQVLIGPLNSIAQSQQIKIMLINNGFSDVMIKQV